MSAIKYPITSILIGLNAYTYYKSQKLGVEEADNRYLFDTWDFLQRRITSSDEDGWAYKIASTTEDITKIFKTMAYSKNDYEIQNNLFTLFVFARPVELIMGTRIMLSILFVCGSLTYLFIKKGITRITTNEDINPHSLTIPLAVLSQYSNIHTISKPIWAGSIIYWICLIFNRQDYDWRAGLFSGFLLLFVERMIFRI